jgi:hypothetical protein
VPTQKLMRADGPADLVWELRLEALGSQPIRGRVARVLVAEPNPDEDTQAIRIGRQGRLASRKEQDLVGARITDSRETLEELARRVGVLLHCPP